MDDVTKRLNADGNFQDRELFEHLYGELQRIARGKMSREREGHTLNTGGLVHETWLRLEEGAPDRWRDRSQFYAAAAEAMRRILVDSARRRLAAKRGDGAVPVPADQIELFAPLPDKRLLAVHEALDQLEKENELNARIVKLRYFGGLKHREIATVLEMGETTVRRHWAVAKVWLYRALKDEL